MIWLLAVGFLISSGAILSLELLELRVPSHVPLGARAAMACRWQLAPGEVLYSVKWYKDGKEFFRHVPKDVEPRRRFPLPGVDVQKSDSYGSTVTLFPAVLETGGRYRCEVSGERPIFPTVSDHSDMLVVALPRHGPTISGISLFYEVRDRVRVNCTSGRSRPATRLAWYVNGEPAPAAAQRAPLRHKHPDGLETTTLGLDFRATEDDFVEGIIKVKCLATLGTIYWRSSEESARRTLNNDTIEKVLERRVKNACGSVNKLMKYLIITSAIFISYAFSFL